MVPGVITARRLESAQRSAVVNVLAEAFEYDPMQAWLFPNPRRRLQRLRRFYERDLAVRLEGTATVCLLGARAVAFWQPPAGGETLSIHSAIRLAPCFVSVAAHHPFAAMNVLGAVLRQRPREPHWYLTHLAVRPGDQGRGLGRILLQWGIERADEEGVGTYLETANPDNLPFYRAAGYSQVGLVRVDDAPNVWTLWRGPTDMNSPAPPRQPADAAEVRTLAERDRSREDAT
jgi:ribosomal protein S18 acetylase RimI-like enzyme